MKNEEGRFFGRRAIVTGAASGIGQAVACALAREGANVHAWDLNGKGLKSTRSLAGGDMRSHAIDVRNLDEVSELLEKGQPELLVHCAAIGAPTPLKNECRDVWDKVFSTNFEGSRNVLLGAAQIMRKSNGGRILTVSSIHASLHEFDQAAYGVSKAATERLVQAIAVEFAPDNILINILAPGFVDTPMSRINGVHELETENLQARFIESGRLPIGRPALPEEIAALALLLLDPSNTYLTGQTIIADGGLTLTL